MVVLPGSVHGRDRQTAAAAVGGGEADGGRWGGRTFIVLFVFVPVKSWLLLTNSDLHVLRGNGKLLIKLL